MFNTYLAIAVLLDFIGFNFKNIFIVSKNCCEYTDFPSKMYLLHMWTLNPMDSDQNQIQ